MGDPHCTTCRCVKRPHNTQPSEFESLDIYALLRDPSYCSSPSYPNPKLDCVLDQAVAAETELAAIAMSIDDLRKHLALLESKQAHLITQVEKCQSLKSPIRSLPDDVLLYIFHYCAGKGTEILPSDPPHRRYWQFYSPILEISGTCHRWHSLAMSQHSLWTGFSTTRSLAMEPESRQRAAMKLVQRHLDRAADVPLSMELHYFTLRHKSLPPVVSALLAARSRSRSLTITTTFSSLVDSLSGNDQYPVLEYLNLDIVRSIDGLIDAFSRAPRLHTVTLSGITLDSIILPWAKLRSLTLKEVAVFDALRITERTGHLQTLHLSHLNGVDMSPNDKTLELPIESLEISSRYICDCNPTKPRNSIHESLFRSIRCPNLSSLTVQEYSIHYGEGNFRTCKEPARFNVPSFSKFLSLSSKLTTLTLRSLQMKEDELLHLLECVPGVTTLTLEPYDTEITNAFFRRLSFVESSPTKPILPRLENLSLSNNLEGFTIQAVVDMVRSRHKHPLPNAAQLRFFSWCIDSPLGNKNYRPSIAADFEAIEGLATFVRYYSVVDE